MLMSTIIVDKDNARQVYKQKNGALGPFFYLSKRQEPVSLYFMSTFLIDEPESVTTSTK
jgi:hypothetical protein